MKDSAFVLEHLGIACFKSAKTLELTWPGDGKFDLSPLFRYPGITSLESAIFRNCRLPSGAAWSDSKALVNITNFSLRGYAFDDAIKNSLQTLPRLKEVCLQQSNVLIGYPMRRLMSNYQVETLASYLTSRNQVGKLILNLVGSPGSESFPAITKWLKNSKGTLELRLTVSPPNVDFAVQGLESLRRGLKSFSSIHSVIQIGQ